MAIVRLGVLPEFRDQHGDGQLVGRRGQLPAGRDPFGDEPVVFALAGSAAVRAEEKVLAVQDDAGLARLPVLAVFGEAIGGEAGHGAAPGEKVKVEDSTFSKRSLAALPTVGR